MPSQYGVRKLSRSYGKSGGETPGRLVGGAKRETGEDSLKQEPAQSSPAKPPAVQPEPPPPTPPTPPPPAADAGSVLEGILEAGEEITWSCRPSRPGEVLMRGGTWAMVLGSVWTLLAAIYLVYPAVTNLGLVLKGLFPALSVMMALACALAFTAAGVWMVWYPIHRKRQLIGIWYAVTNRRVLQVWKSRDEMHWREWRADEIPPVRYTKGASPYNTVVWHDAELAPPGTLSKGQEDGLYHIADHREGATAVAAIESLRQSAASASRSRLETFQPEIRLADAVRARVEKKLRPEEKLLWAEQPVGRLLAFSGASGGMAFAGLMLAGVVCSQLFLSSAMEQSHQSHVSNQLGSFLVPFAMTVVASSLVLVLPWRWKNAAKTVFAITNQRTLTLTLEATGVSVESHRPADFHFPVITEFNPPFGSIHFIPDPMEVIGSTSTGFDGVFDTRSAARALLIQHELLLGKGAGWKKTPESAP